MIITILNPNSHYNTEGYKECAGKGCKGEGKTFLKIKYLQKKGYFCDICKAEVLQLELSVPEEGNKIETK